jgi:nucleotide-binding universal stress UspA family protein
MKVIVAIEDELFGNAIIDFIGTQRWASGTEFELVHVIDYPPTSETIGELCCMEAQRMFDEEQAAMRKLLMDLDLRLIKLVPDVQSEQKILFGFPKDKLLHEVEDTKADLLIVGSHGRRGFSRFLLGSVSMAMLSHAPCSVLIVKIPAEKRAETEKKMAASANAT